METGYYWVRYPGYQAWEIAVYANGVWQWMAEVEDDTVPEMIGPYIPQPDDLVAIAEFDYEMSQRHNACP